MGTLKWQTEIRSKIFQTSEKMQWHTKPIIDKKPENINIHRGTNDIAADIINLSGSVSEESTSNVIISGLVPRKGYLNAKVRDINNDNF